MPSPNRFLLAAGALALATAAWTPAWAAGTSAGSTITNQANVDYTVGGFAQTRIQRSTTVTVDRKVVFTVVRSAGASTTVSPNQSGAVFGYQLTNSSNDKIDFVPSVAQSSADDFDVTNVRYYHDANGNGVLDGSDTLVTYIDELAEDASYALLVVVDVPQATATGNIADITLTARAHAGGTASSQGALLTATAGANTAGVDTVLADAAGASDAQYDGAFSAVGRFTVLGATLTVVKSARIVSDPVNLGTNPKAIPGATVEYCIAVSNAAGSATAQGVSINDPVPADVTYDSSFGIFVNGTLNGSNACNSDGTSGGAFAANTVTGALSDIAAGAARTLYFRATIN
ncbi:MAG: hypothetical protein NTX28_12940 [Novosphingobium sp.]|nr:hypothetical protein [Novosphingobium sp.]